MSKSMEEIWKIKEENSKKYLNMTPEELKAEEERLIKWFLDATGKDESIVIKPNEAKKTSQTC